MKRTPRQQSKHDKAVEKSAKYYEQMGFGVQADIKGYDKPKTIGDRRPDAVAQKGKKKIILEVETKDTVTTDKKQQETFKKYAEGRKNVRFRRKIV